MVVPAWPPAAKNPASPTSPAVFSCVMMSNTPGTARASERSMRSMRPREIALVTRKAQAGFTTGLSEA